jgi:hypothetical protein
LETDREKKMITAAHQAIRKRSQSSATAHLHRPSPRAPRPSDAATAKRATALQGRVSRRK